MLKIIYELGSKVYEHFNPIQRATTTQEKEAIYRLRYEVTVAEQNSTCETVAHKNHRLWTPEDDLENAVHYYIGTSDNIIGALRFIWWKPGEVPEKYYRYWSMDRIPGVERFITFETAKAVVRPDQRGKLAGLILGQRAVYLITRDVFFREEHQGIILLSQIAPGLVKFWEETALRPYGGRLLNGNHGLVVPMMIAPHFRAPKGAPLLTSLFHPTKFMPQKKLCWSSEDRQAFDRMTMENTGIVTKPVKIADRIKQFRETAGNSLLHRLPERIIKMVSEKSVLINVEPGLIISLQDKLNRELHIPLTGKLDILQNGALVRQVGPGALLGATECFNGEGKRLHEVRAASEGELLIVHRSLIKKLTKKDPKDALLFSQKILNIMSEELTKTFIQES